MSLNVQYERGKGRPLKSYGDLRQFLRDLGDSGHMPTQRTAMSNDLRTIRDQVVYPEDERPSVTEAQAWEYSNLAARFVERIKQVGS